MLVLSRKVGETIRIGSEVHLVVLEVNRGRVKLGFSGPREILLRRGELGDLVSMPEPGPAGRERPAGALLNETCKPAIAPLRAFRMAGAS